MAKVLIIGGNRGIGLALAQEIVRSKIGLTWPAWSWLITEQTARDPAATVFATTRNPSDSHELHDLAIKTAGRVIVLELDMLDEASIQVSGRFHLS